MPVQERNAQPSHAPDGLRVRRVAVVGNAGGGKSTLCEVLGKALSLPVYSLDSIKWRPGWQPVPEAEVERQCLAWIAQDQWIIDGFGSWEFMDAEFERAEAIICIDLPLRVHYFRAFKRQIRDLFQTRKDLPENCPMYRMTIPMFKTIWFTHWLARPRLLELLDRFRPTRTVLHLQTRSSLNRLIAHPASLTPARPVEQAQDGPA